MDVERIQKINSLALDLMKQGLASDREDAMIQAEKIFRNRDMGGYDSLWDTMQKVQEEAHSKPVVISTSPSSEAFGEEKVKEILEKNTQFIVKTLKEFQEKLQALEGTIASLRSQLATVRPNDSASHASSVPRGESSSPATASHPRSGNYKNEDVSIEKFFNYSGTK